MVGTSGYCGSRCIRRDRQRTHAAGLHHADRIGDVEPRHLDVAVAEVADDLGAAVLERNVQELDAGALGEHLGVDLLIAADAGAAVADLARMRLGVGDEFGEGLGREVGRGRQEEHRHVGEPRHDLHVLAVVDLHLLGEQDRGQPVGRDIADHQRVAVGPRARHFLDRDDPGGAGLVLDHHALAERLAQLLGEQPRHHVGQAAGRIGHDDLDRLRRIGSLRGGAGRAERERKCGDEKPAEAPHSVPRLIRSLSLWASLGSATKRSLLLFWHYCSGALVLLEDCMDRPWPCTRSELGESALGRR